MNEKNIQFYNNLGVDPFKQLSQIGGFATKKDLEIVYPFIKDANTIVELGAGYGRCLDFFIEKGFTGKLIAVEKARPYLEYLKTHYSDKAEILDQDINTLKLDKNADVILWMFSGIIDFSPEEQLEAVKNLYQYLQKSGKLVIDIPKIGFKTYATHKDAQHLKLENQYGTLECYIPSFEDIIRYQQLSGYTHVIRKDYVTPAEKERTVYILEK